ncbi:hypothetical protein MBLNU459_g5423t1 [Dothideomycetes sp. NU459]
MVLILSTSGLVRKMPTHHETLDEGSFELADMDPPQPVYSGSPRSSSNSTTSSGNSTAASDNSTFGLSALSKAPVAGRARLWDLNKTFPTELPPRPMKQTWRSSGAPAINQTMPIAATRSGTRADVEANNDDGAGVGAGARKTWRERFGNACRQDRSSLGFVVGATLLMVASAVGIGLVGAVLSGALRLN